MANYVKNPTWADGAGGGTAITAAKLNNIESGIYDAHFTPAAHAYHNANQSITNATWTSIALNSERFDTDTIHDTSTNNSRLTCKTAGKYQITGSLDWVGHATGYRITRILLNGSTIIDKVSTPTNSASVDTSHTVSTLYDLAVNDYVEMQGYQTSGAGLNVVGGIDNSSPEFMMARVA